MAFCAKCGKELPAGATFCPSCGAAVQQVPQASATQAQTTPISGFDMLMKDPKAQDYWLKRLLAFIVDAIIVFVGLAIITVLATLPFLLVGAVTRGSVSFSVVFGSASLLWGIIFVLYFTLAESTSGASIGKNLFGFKVVSKTGSNPSLGEAFIRNLSKIHWVLLLLDVVVGLALSKGYQQKYSDQFVGTTVTFKQASLHSA
jgi:uncharacterized RDD family membrane protein YckC